MRRLSLSTAAKVAGLAVLAAAAGVAVLVWALVATGGPNGENRELPPGELSGLTLEEAYARISEALDSRGLVLHSTLEARGRDATGEMTPYYTKEFWIDAERETLREEFRLDPERDSYDIAEESLAIVVGEYIYVPDDPDEALRFEVEDFCPRTTDAILSAFLECGGSYPYLSLEGFEARGEPDAEYEGRPAVALVFEQRREQQLADDQPFPPGASPVASPMTVEIWTVLRLYLDSDSFLPIARVVEHRQEGELYGELVSAYEHEFIPADSLPSDFLDPHSIGYGAENESVLLDEIARNVPVYWLGSEFEPTGGFDPLVLVRMPRRSERGIKDPGMTGWLVYDTPRGLSGVHVLLWRPEEWETFLQSEMGTYLLDPSCADRRETELGGRQVTVYSMLALRYPLTPESLGPCVGRIAYPTLTDTTLIAIIDLGEVVVDIRPDPTGDYRSLAAMEAVVKGLQAR